MKSAVSYISDFETQLVELAKVKQCDGIICGHIHQPAIKEYGDVVYMNSGDWVESLSALTEDEDGEWNLVYYTETEKAGLQYESGTMDWEELEDDEKADLEALEEQLKLVRVLKQVS